MSEQILINLKQNKTRNVITYSDWDNLRQEIRMKILSCYDKILGFSKVLALNAFSKQVVFQKKKRQTSSENFQEIKYCECC